MKQAKVVDPAAQDERDVVRFGATVELADEEDERRDADPRRRGRGRRHCRADQLERADRPRAGRRAGRRRTASCGLPGGEKSYEVIAISYPAPSAG